MAQTNIARVVRGRTELWVPHNGHEIAFVYPSAGPDTYRNVGKSILNQGQRIPTGDETASLLYATYCIPEFKDEHEFWNVKDIMRNRWLWVFNTNLWTAKGVYVLQDTKAERSPLVANQLEKKLKAGKEIGGVRFSIDGKVRFAPKETYQSGEQTPQTLAKDGFIIASFGKEGAEKLKEISLKIRVKPYVWCFKTNRPVQGVSAFGSGVDRGLCFGGEDFVEELGGEWGSQAFGVLE